MDELGRVTATRDEIDWLVDSVDKFTGNIERFMKGVPDLVRHLVICLLADGHALLAAPPGVGKTALAKAIIASIDGRMSRIQFTPDLMPQDIIGVQIYNQTTGEFVLHPGPILANLVLADEINRAPAKVQSALLEAMGEGQCSIDGIPLKLDELFVVIATMNPLDFEGTYPLPEAQIDRFTMCLNMGLPEQDVEMDILAGHLAGDTPQDLSPVLTVADVIRMRSIARRVEVDEAIRRFIVELTNRIRRNPDVRRPPSTRAVNALGRAARARAAVSRRTFATIDDVRAVAPAVLAHRLGIGEDGGLRHHKAEAVVAQESLATSVRV